MLISWTTVPISLLATSQSFLITQNCASSSKTQSPFGIFRSTTSLHVLRHDKYHFTPFLMLRSRIPFAVFTYFPFPFYIFDLVGAYLLCSAISLSSPKSGSCALRFCLLHILYNFCFKRLHITLFMFSHSATFLTWTFSGNVPLQGLSSTLSLTMTCQASCYVCTDDW